MPRSSVLNLAAVLDPQGEPFARLLADSLQAVLEGEMTEFLGAAAGERTQARTGQRAGHRRRRLATQVGMLELRVPRDRASRFNTALFDRYARGEKTFIARLAEMHARGVTAARVRHLTPALCAHALSAHAIEQIRQGIDDALERFARNSIQEGWPYVLLQGQRTRVRIDGVVRSSQVHAAVGMDRHGRTRLLAVDLVCRQRRPDWKGMLRGLKRRGWHGARTVVVEDGTRQRSARGTSDAGRLRAGHDALADRRAAGVAATGKHRAQSHTRSPGPRPRWRLARYDESREEVEAPPAALQQDVERGPVEVEAAPPRPTGVAANLPERAPVVADAAEHEQLALAPWPSPGPASRATLLFEHKGFFARAAERIGRTFVWTGVGGALVIAGVLRWNMDSTDPSPAAVAEAQTPASLARSLPGPVRMTSPQLSVAPSRVAPEPAVSRFQLRGVVAAARADGPGIALIAIDGGPARAFRVGASVDGDLVLQRVSQGGATLGPANGRPLVMLDVVVGAIASSATPQPGEGRPVEVGAEPPPVQGTVASMQAAALVAAVTQSSEPGAAESWSVLAADLLPDALPAAQPPSTKPSPGRRSRLRHVNAQR